MALHEAELLVIVGADEFGGVDGATLQRGIHIARRDLLGDDAELGQHLPANASDAELQTLEVIDAVQFLAEEAAHLAAGIAGRDGVGVVLARTSLMILSPPLKNHQNAAGGC